MSNVINQWFISHPAQAGTFESQITGVVVESLMFPRGAAKDCAPGIPDGIPVYAYLSLGLTPGVFVIVI